MEENELINISEKLVLLLEELRKLTACIDEAYDVNWESESQSYPPCIWSHNYN